MKEIIKSYLKKLTKLSGSSRSILLPRLTSKQFIDIHDFNYAIDKPSFDLISQLIAHKNNIPLCSVQDSRDADSNQLSKRVKSLTRIEKLIYEERGTKDLYIGWPFVKGKFSDGTLTRCPLMFFPVSIHSNEKTWFLSINKEVNITLNKSFLLAYAHYNELPANEKLLERAFNDFDKLSQGFRTDLYQLLSDENLEINFNQDNFRDQLTSFENYTKKDLELSEKDGELKLFPQAVLGIFPQASSHLVPDYLEILKNDNIQGLEDFFLERNLDESEDSDTSNYRFLRRVTEDQTFTPFRMDAYQENVVKAVKKGNSAVISGPPGTGKSQLICNLIADYIARGKNVLLVSQKKAALDVVFERLKEKDLNDFIGLLHDFKNDRKSIFEQLKSQVDSLGVYESKNNSLDTIELERNFLKTSRRIDQLEEEIQEFKDALFDESECGLSVKELYLTSSLKSPHFLMNQDYSSFKFGNLSPFLSQLKSYYDYAVRLNKEHHPWNSRLNFTQFDVNDLSHMLRHLTDMRSHIDAFEEQSLELLSKKFSYDDLLAIISSEPFLSQLVQLMKEEVVFKGLSILVKYEDSRVDKKWLNEWEERIMSFYGGDGAELSLESHALGKFQEAIERHLDARKGLLKWVKWKLFSKDRIFINRVLSANKLTKSKESIDVLVSMIDNRLNLEHNITQLKKHTELLGFPKIYKKVAVQNWFFYQKQSVEARDILNRSTINEYLPISSYDREDYIVTLEKLLEVILPISNHISQWKQYFSIHQIRKIFSKELSTSELSNSLSKDFDSLCEFDKIKDGFNPDQLKIIEKIDQERTSNDEASSWMTLFDNSLRLAWISHIESKYPILRAVSSQKLVDMELEIQQGVEEKLRISKQILLMKVRERVYQNLEYNRLNNMVTYRGLYHQVSKKKRVWPVRKLIANHPREVFDLIPCWLVSPEAASAIFPMDKIFDLVIFDEASQCFAENGIPSMYRGKQVVVAGDQKQLPPNDVYNTRWEDDHDEEIEELAFDSLLDLSSQYLMKAQLNGHYRSKNLDLIRFSNAHFYDNRLQMLPDFADLNSRSKAIEYIKVDGIWENNRNVAEAQKVAELVEQLVNENPTLSIGIVTFNVRQQIYILEYIEQYAIDHGFILPNSLIVKNIENIQGDEKDIIIFSTIYAPDSSGKMKMNFGSLNVKGGENRLNVAITRARQKIYLVSSIYPQQLHVEDAKNEGPKLLKEYLSYAYNISNGTSVELGKQKESQHSPDWFLKNKIVGMLDGLDKVEADYSMPFVDLALVEGQRFLGAVVTDDGLYHQDISVRASHVYKPFLLSEKHWNYMQVYSRQLWLDTNTVEERLKRMVFRAKNDD